MRTLAHSFALGVLVCFTSSAQNGAGIQGRWNASVEPKGAPKEAGGFEMVFQFSVAADGRIQGTFAVPQAGVESAPITSVTVNGAEVRMQIGGLRAEFQGTLDASGTVIAGALNRSGTLLPMRLILLDRKLSVRAEPKPAPKEVVDWFRSSAIPLKTTAPGQGFEDLRPLRAIVGDARIVAMGEATHGTREFFLLKHRILEFLVSEMGFTMFGIEANWPESLALNRYLLTGEGDPVELLNGLHFWTCNSQEVLDMVRWMRAYNQNPAHARKVKLFGFDMQYPVQATRGALAFLGKTDPDGAKEFARATEVLASRGDVAIGDARLSDDQWHQIATAAADLVQRFDRKKEEYIARSSEAEWTLARQQVVIVRQAAVLKSGRERDQFMAENAKWALDQEPAGTRMIVWAHNDHVASAPAPDGHPPMGMHLRRMYGEAMVNLGFAFNQGQFRAFGIETQRLQAFTAEPAPAGTLDATLTATGLPLFLVDLRRAPKAGAVAEWFAQGHGCRSIGSTYNAEMESTYYYPFHIAQSFDLLIFVERTSAALAVPRQ